MAGDPTLYQEFHSTTQWPHNYSNKLTASSDITPESLDALGVAIHAPLVLQPNGPGTPGCPLPPGPYHNPMNERIPSEPFESRCSDAERAGRLFPVLDKAEIRRRRIDDCVREALSSTWQFPLETYVDADMGDVVMTVISPLFVAHVRAEFRRLEGK